VQSADGTCARQPEEKVAEASNPPERMFRDGKRSMAPRSMEVSVLGRIGYDLFAVEHGRPLAEVEHFSRHLGGSSANIGVGLARLGLSVGIISRLGKDLLADYLLHFLDQEGVSTEFVRLVEGYSTSLSLSQVSPPDQFPQVFYRHRPADTQVVVGEEEVEFIRNSRMFVTNGTSLSASPAREATRLALRTAREAGVMTAFDIDYRASSWPSPEAAGKEASRALPWVDVVVGNEEECRLLTGEESPSRQVEKILEKGVRIVVRKLGSKGVEAHTKDERHVADPLPAQVVCTIGAGDGFAAGFLFALLKDLPLPQCLRFGNAVASIVVSRVSCSDAMPYFSELQSALQIAGFKTIRS
jgi:5-dehydro-2-deoxygluconokinase